MGVPRARSDTRFDHCPRVFDRRLTVSENLTFVFKETSPTSICSSLSRAMGFTQLLLSRRTDLFGRIASTSPLGLLGLRHLASSLPHHGAALPTLPPFAHVPATYTGPSAEEVLKLRKQYLSPCRTPMTILMGYSTGSRMNMVAMRSCKDSVASPLTHTTCSRSTVTALQEAPHDCRGQTAVPVR